MILGMSLSTFTTVHVIISLIGIASGVVVLLGMLTDRRFNGLTELFLATTILTSVTGFFFPTVGIISLVLLAGAVLALSVYRLGGFWRPIYIVCAVIALYLNVFVGVVQAFQKVSFLQPLAPTQSEPPFLVAQVLVLAIFVVLGFLAIKKFHPDMTVLA
jgi:hypothetical protein